jgi:hypothetical protein
MLIKAAACAIASLTAVVMLNASVAESHDAATASAPGKRRLAPAKTAYITLTHSSLASLLRALDVPAVSAPNPIRVRAAAPVAPARTLLPVVNKEDIRPQHRILADTVLRALPRQCRDNLTNFYVRYDNPAQRGLGGKNTIILNGGVPDNEFIALLVHECGHITHAALSGTPGPAVSAFKDGSQVFYADSPAAAFFSISWQTERVRKQGTTAHDFASGYAPTDSFEYFAEAYALYMLHEEAFAERAQENDAMRRELEWMRAHFPNVSLPVTSTYTWDKKVPWDVTKLPFVWNG